MPGVERDHSYTADLYDDAYYASLAGAERRRSHRWRCHWVEMALQPRPGDRILDLGCGTGLVSKYLLARGATVHGIDLSAPAVQAARRLNADNPRGTFTCADARSCEHLEASWFHKACSVDVTEHCGHQAMLEIFREAHRLLRPGAPYFVYTPNPLHWIERAKARGFLTQDPMHTGLRPARVLMDALTSCGFHMVKDFQPPSMIPGLNLLERLWSQQPVLRQLGIYRIAILARKEPGVAGVGTDPT